MRIFLIKKTALTAVVVALSTLSVVAQDMTSYFMPNVIERKSFNASFAPDRGYVNVPIVGATTISASGNVSLGDLISTVDGENCFILDTRVSAADALSGLKENNYFSMNSNISLLGAGSYMADGKSFWSFDLNLRTSASLSAPYELFEFLKTAPEQATINSASNLYMESYVEAAFGYSRPLLFDNLIVGTRVKLLAGLMSARVDIEQMDVTLSSDEWNVQAKGFLEMNSKGVSIDSTSDVFLLEDVEMGIDGISGFGAAIDLGASYDLGDRIHLSASVNDIGFISWSKSSNTSASVAEEFSFVGANVDVSESGTTVDSGSAISLGDMEFVKESPQRSTTTLQANINMGAEYDIFGELLSAGGVYSIRFWRAETIHNLTMALTTTPLKWVTIATSYSVTNNGSNSFGCAANFATRFFNLYMSTDILTAKKSPQLIPINQTMMNVSFGLAVPLARVGSRNKDV